MKLVRQLLWGSVLLATQAGAESQPRSAIPWLSTILSDQVEPTTSDPATNDVITVTSLGDRSRNGIGILTPEQSGIPADIWVKSDPARIVHLLNAARYDGPPAVRSLFRRLLLTDFTPPGDESPSSDLLLARIDLLLKIGALNEAVALIDRVGADTDYLFSRWFDVSLLTDNAEEACAALAYSPMLSPAKNVQIFCLVRTGDWDAAAVALTLGETLGQLSPEDSQLLSFFLDPALIDEVDPPDARDPLTALEFLIRESVGLPRPDQALPLAFLHADLADFVPVRFRMAAAERLLQAGAITPSVLFSAYREEPPASSGGIWERSASVQDFDDAQLPDVAAQLTKLDLEMRRIDLRHAAAMEFGPILATWTPDTVPETAYDLIAVYLLLAQNPGDAKRWITSDSPAEIKTAAIVSGLDFAIPPTLSARDFALLAPFLESDPARLLTLEMRRDLADQRTGEIMVAAINLLAQSEQPDPGDVSTALAALRSVDQDQVARNIAVQMLLMGVSP